MQQVVIDQIKSITDEVVANGKDSFLENCIPQLLNCEQQFFLKVNSNCAALVFIKDYQINNSESNAFDLMPYDNSERLYYYNGVNLSLVSQAEMDKIINTIKI